MPYYRILLDIKYRDLLVEAKDEREASDMVWKEYSKFRPFGGSYRSLVTRVRKPWKHQMKKLGEKI